LDNLTHSLFALTLARTPLGRAGRGTTAALLLASNAPDIDIVSTAGGALKYLEWHRGPTHGPLGIVGLGLAVAAIVHFGRRYSGEHPTERDAPFVRLALVSIIGVILHVLMDLPTSYGTRPLSPFDWHWYAEDWLPIVDIYLLAILGAALVLGSRSPADAPSPAGLFLDARSRNAAIALTLMAANYGLRGATHTLALARVDEVFGALLPPRCEARIEQGLVDRWPREVNPEGATSASRCLVEVAAMPTFLSPFRWRLIAHLSDAYELRDVDLLDMGTPIGASSDEPMSRVSTRFPNRWTDTVRRASLARAAQVFLGFARFPAARYVVDAAGDTTVRWTDVRFVADAGPGRRAAAQSGLFSAVVRVGPNQQILDERLGAR